MPTTNAAKHDLMKKLNSCNRVTVMAEQCSVDLLAQGLHGRANSCPAAIAEAGIAPEIWSGVILAWICFISKQFCVGGWFPAGRGGIE